MHFRFISDDNQYRQVSKEQIDLSLMLFVFIYRNVVTHFERQISNEVMDEVEGEKGQKNPDEKMISDGATSTSTTKKNAIWNDQW